jgi:hypothetical protein
VEDFLVVEVSPAVVEEAVESVAAAFLDFEDFLAVVPVSPEAAVVEESELVVDFLDLDDFEVEESVEVSSDAAFFFFDLDFVVLSLWSVD